MKFRVKPRVKISHLKKIPPRIVKGPVTKWADHLVVRQSNSNREILSSSPICSVESLTTRPEINMVDVQDKTISTDKEKNGHGLDTTQDAAGESWVIQVKERFRTQQYKDGQSSDVSIYRVPATIRAPKPEAYVPLVASFGPYHHLKKDQLLYAIDDYKLEAVQRTVERIGGITIDDLIAEVGNLEKKIRNCYEDSANEYSKDTLSWMFTMDACFILEFFRTSVTKSPKEEDNTKLANEEEHAKEQERFSLLFEYNGRQNIFRDEIMRDIIKLENQIPLFVLSKILELECKNKGDAVLKSVDLLLPLREFTGFPFSLPSSDDKMQENIDGEIRSRLEKHIKGASHLLDLSRRMIKDILTDSSYQSTASARTASVECGVSCLTDNLKSLSSNSSDDDSTPSAEKLHKAGIIFKPTTTGEVKFEGRYFLSSTFYIHEITVDDDTEIILRNLIAFEECQGSRLSPEPTVISNYIHLMDDLVDTSVDVGLLKKGKVIRSLVGSDEEIAATINDLCRGITDNPYPPYEEVVKKVREHFKSRPKVWLGQFRQERCSKPWYVVSLAVAALLLGMTAVQTIFAVKK